MGNHNSSRNLHQPPATWTQSFPRDNRRLQKMGVSTDNRVLPERGPAPRLRPTENGRSLHVAGTITARRVSQPPEGPPPGIDHRGGGHRPGGHSTPGGPQSLPGYISPVNPCPAHPNGPPAPIHAMHSTSMTHLHQQCAVHPPPGLDPSRAGSMHELRFGPPPSKVYTSEPDLRAGGSASVPMPQHSPHTIIGQSPTKGRIKSKKRNRAPPPPPTNGAFSDGYVHEHNSRISSDTPRAVHWGTSDTQSRPPSQVSSSRSKSKSRKMGLFKKRSESRRSDNESSFTDDQSRSRYRNSPMLSPLEHSKEEKRERARSVDCLQHELRRGSPLTTSMANRDSAVGRGSSSDETNSSNDKETRRRSQTIERDSRRNSRVDEIDHRLSTTMERNPRSQSRDSQRRQEEFRPHSKVEERRSHELQWSRSSYMIKQPYGSPHGGRTGVEKQILERRASSSAARPERIPMNKAFDEWEQAEKEVSNRKRISANMKQELLNAAKNLRKSSVEPKVEEKNDVSRKNSAINITKEEERTVHSVNVQQSLSAQKSADKDVPKTFFFGMEPGNATDTSASKNKSTKSVETEEVRIEGASVGYSKRNSEVIQRSRSKSKDSVTASRLSDHGEKPANNGKISKDVDEFAVAIERRKQNNFVRDDLFGNSIRREDGGYHSRQNSGSFHLENENPSDEDLGISVNLRPVLPKRQREIPRFSPNAAWRFLGEEPFLAEESNNLNESRSSEEVDAVFEDKIRGYARPVAPPRGSGEKSADSGISGDAGSPGPMQEFEPITPSSAIKIVNGPLAASSPVASGRSEARRAWTPAQDLDENSLDGSGESPSNRVVQNNTLSTPPKLTSRANMFSLFGLKEGKMSNSYCQTDDSLNESGKSSKHNATIDESSAETMSNFRKLKRSVSGSINVATNTASTLHEANSKIDLKTVETDKWRDNWCMTRSIPHSLNNCDETDSRIKVNGKPEPPSTRIEPTQPVAFRRLHSEGDSPSSVPSAPRNRTPSYITTGQAGHIMYLPEYNSHRIPDDEFAVSGEIRSRDLNSSKHLSRFSNGDQRSSENLDIGPTSLPPFLASPGNSPVGARIKKGKKFSYQSTVRVLEKRKIEEKLNREVATKEKQRIQEASAMRQVEEEFQLKREREKKRLKQQLKLYQAMQGARERGLPGESPTYTRNDSLNYPDDSPNPKDDSTDRYHSDPQNTSIEEEGPQSPFGFPKEYSTNSLMSPTSKKMVGNKGRSPSSHDLTTNGFHSKEDYLDANIGDSARVTSTDHSQRISVSITNGGEYPLERGYTGYYKSPPKEVGVDAGRLGAGARLLSGDETASSSVRHAITSKSTTDGRASQRTLQSNLDSDAESTYLPSVSSVSGRSQSSDGRRNRHRPAPDGAPSNGPRSEAVVSARARNELMTQELPEQQLPRREYREYRRSHRASMGQGGGVSDNYRRDFSRGQVQTALEEKSSRLSLDGRRPTHGSSTTDFPDTASSCSSVSRGPPGGRPQPPSGVVMTRVIRTVRGPPDHPTTQVTKYYEHPPALGNMSPANGRAGSPFQQFSSSEGAFNRHVVQPTSYGSPPYRPGDFSSPPPGSKLLRT